MTEADVYLLIARAHAAPEWACFRHVADATAGRATRRADAIAMSLWPSRGLIIRGFEIKTDRGDWLRELRAPAKAEALGKFCDEWFIVAPSGVVDLERDTWPPAWGLMVVKAGVLRQKVKPQPRCAEVASRGFMAAIFRAAHAQVAEVLAGYVPRGEIAAEIAAAREEGERLAPTLLANAQRDHDRLRKALETFKAATGIDVFEGAWNDRSAEVAAQYNMGRIVHGRFGERMPELLRNLERASRALGDVYADLNKTIDKQC